MKERRRVRNMDICKDIWILRYTEKTKRNTRIVNKGRKEKEYIYIYMEKGRGLYMKYGYGKMIIYRIWIQEYQKTIKESGRDRCMKYRYIGVA